MALELATRTAAPGERNCPLTCGGPIRMTRAGFDRCCAAMVAKAKDADTVDKNRASYSRIQVSFQDPCLNCQGPPALLTFIEVPDLQLIGGHHLHSHLAPEVKKKTQQQAEKAKLAEAMHNNWKKKGKSSTKTESIEVPTNNGGDMAGTKRCIGECSVCGMKKNVARRQEGNICPTCENMRTYVKKRPEVALAMLRKMAPELMSGEAISQMSPGKEEDIVKVRFALGCKIDENLIQVAERRMAVITKLEDSYLKESVALSNAEAERDDLKRQVAELQAELISARKATQIIQEVENAAPVEMNTASIPQLKDLALRIAFGLLEGNGVDVSVKDVELLMAV